MNNVFLYRGVSVITNDYIYGYLSFENDEYFIKSYDGIIAHKILKSSLQIEVKYQDCDGTDLYNGDYVMLKNRYWDSQKTKPVICQIYFDTMYSAFMLRDEKSNIFFLNEFKKNLKIVKK
jgi:hypothetical protein